MSHFTVIVTGDNVEDALEPFDENLEVEPYESTWDTDATASFLNYYNLSITGLKRDPELLREKVVDWLGYHPNDHNPYIDDQGSIVVWSTYNPDSKWDWYAVGGRWRGFFLVKEGAKGESGELGLSEMLRMKNGEDVSLPKNRVDSCRVGDVDFEAMRAEALAEVEEYWNHLEAAMSSATPEDVENYRSFEELQDKDKFWAQPLVTHFLEYERERGQLGGFFGPHPIDIYLAGKDKYVEEVLDSVAVPYAILHDGEWMARGQMGWFGVSINEEKPVTWKKKVREFYENLDPDTVVTLVDCHI